MERTGATLRGGNGLFLNQKCRMRLAGPSAASRPWMPEFPDGEVDDSFHGCNRFERVFHFSMPSAFRLLVRLGDYRAARDTEPRARSGDPGRSAGKHAAYVRLVFRRFQVFVDS